jgi:hypothetical protein
MCVRRRQPETRRIAGTTWCCSDDGCAAFSPEIHEAALLSFQGPFGRVRKTDEVLALLDPNVRHH